MEQNMQNIPDKQDRKQAIGKVWNIAIGVLCAVILWQLFSLRAEWQAIHKTPDTISQTEIKTLNLSVTTMTQIVVDIQKRLERLEQEIRAVSMNKLKADEVAVAQAMKKAQEALARNDTALAKLYLMLSITLLIIPLAFLNITNFANRNPTLCQSRNGDSSVISLNWQSIKSRRKK